MLIGLLSVCILFGGEKMRSGGALGDRALPSVGADHRAARTGNGALSTWLWRVFLSFPKGSSRYSSLC